MAWIESHQELRDHPKVKRLARLLDTSVAAAIGHLHALWWWALDYADDGDVSRYDEYDLADAGLWEGDPTAFAKALQGCGPGGTSGFLDGDSLHDWWEYAGKLVDRRQRDRERKAKSRAKADREGVRGTSDGQDVEVSETAYVPNPTQQNPTQPTDGPRKRGTRLPDAWTPNDDHRQIAFQQRRDCDAEAIKFRDHAIAKGRVLKDWDAGFRNWLRQDFGGKKRGPAHAASDVTEAQRHDVDFWSA